MTKTRFTQGIVLACMTALAACTGGDDGVSGNTELIVVIPNGGPAIGGGSSAPGLEFIATVEYTIDCQGGLQPTGGFLPGNPGGGSNFDDPVQINGNLAVVGGRDNPTGICSVGGETCTADADCTAGETCVGGSSTVTGLSEVWQGFMDLPPGTCSVQLRARDSDLEVICTDTMTVDIAPSSLNQVSLALICDVSFQAPVGSLDVDGTFLFRVGNFCPDLFIANCLNDAPPERQILPPPNPPFAGTQCEVRTRDGDSDCGNSCDPQSCVETADGSGLTCTPAAGNLRCVDSLTVMCQNNGDCTDAGVAGPCGPVGLVTTVTCTNALMDCDGNGLPDGGDTCVWAGDLLGEVGQEPESPPAALIPGTFNATCIPPALGGSPGVPVECTATVSDGDVDCDKVKSAGFGFACPGLAPCAQWDEDSGGSGTQAGADALCETADATVCITSVCDNSQATDCSGGACCVGTNEPAGTNCSGENPPLAACDGAGNCEAEACTGDASCDDGNVCTTDTCPPGTCSSNSAACFSPNDCPDPANDTCDGATGVCINAPVGGLCSQGACSVTSNQSCGDNSDCPAGETCNNDSSGILERDGTCNAGTCAPEDECTTATTCPNTPAAPADAQCTAATCTAPSGFSQVCGIDLTANSGLTCDFTTGGAADGTCLSDGQCVFSPDTCNFAQTGNDVTPQSKVIAVGCTNTVTSAQSPFPFELFVDVPVAVVGGSSFTANLDGIGTFPEFFLDAAQSTIPSGVQVAELIEFVATVQVRSGATGAGVELGVDIASLDPGPTSFCTFPTTTVCTQDSDCTVPPCLPPVNLATVPNSTDCAPGGVCAALGKTGPASQCSDNGFCVTGDLVVDFLGDSGNYTAGPASDGDVVFGWDETGISFCSENLTPCATTADCDTADPADVCISNAAQLCPGATAFNGDPACLSDGAPLADYPGRFDLCLNLSAANNNLPVEPNGIRLNASGLFVGIQCSMSEDGGECSTPGTCSITTTTSCGISDECPTGEVCQGVIGQGVGCLCDDITNLDGNCASATCQSGETCVGVGSDDDVVCPTRDIALISCPIN